MTEGPKQRFSVTERTFLWIGAVCGIVSALVSTLQYFGVRDPAQLSSGYSVTSGDVLPIAPLADPSDSTWTIAFPFPLTVRNSGELSAEDAVLRIVYPSVIMISSPDSSVVVEDIFGSNPKHGIMTTVKLGDIHPGESRNLNDLLYAAVQNTMIFRNLQANTLDSVAVSVDFEALVAYDVEIRLSAKDHPERVSHVYLAIGPIRLLASEYREFFSLHKDTLGYSLRRYTVRPSNGPS